VVDVQPQAEINIFTVASGLLYEVGFGVLLGCFWAEALSAIRLDHDPERAPEYQ
jgi:hypothetical protein